MDDKEYFEIRKRIEANMYSYNPDIANFIKEQLHKIDKGEIKDPYTEIMCITVGLDFSQRGTGSFENFLHYYAK